jgi:hypothetical protein
MELRSSEKRSNINDSWRSSIRKTADSQSEVSRSWLLGQAEEAKI